MPGRDPSEDRRSGRACGGAESEGGPDRGAADLRRENLGRIAEPRAEAAGDEEIGHESDPEEARRRIEMAEDDQEESGWNDESRDDVTPPKAVAKDAADTIGDVGDEHPNREIALSCL